MFSNIILYSTVSAVFIFVMHSLYEFFKDMLTIPKEKDMIHKPKELYSQLYNNINNREKKDEKKSKMKDELKEYLRELKTASATESNTKANSVIPEPLSGTSFTSF